MLKKVKATYHNGTFIPNTPCYLPNNTEVELMIDVNSESAHNVVDRETRKEILDALLTRMRQSSLMTQVNPVTLSE
ncbi:MAG: antitoxin AF2212-like protein [Crocosphaera sp.]